MPKDELKASACDNLSIPTGTMTTVNRIDGECASQVIDAIEGVSGNVEEGRRYARPNRLSASLRWHTRKLPRFLRNRAESLETGITFMGMVGMTIPRPR